MALPEIIKDIDARVKDTGDVMTGDLVIEKDTPILRMNNLNSNGYGIIDLALSNQTGGVIFMNGTTRSADGGPNALTIRNDISHLLRLDGNTINTGNLTVGSQSIDSSMKLSVSGSARVTEFLHFGTTNTGMIYADSTATTVAGLVVCGSNGWYNGASAVFRTCDSANDYPGGFIIKAQKNVGLTDDGTDCYSLCGNPTNGLLSWTGSLSINSNLRQGATGHTISTSGSIGCAEEIYSGTGFYGGNYHYHVNGAWRCILGNHGNGNVEMNAATGGLCLGLNNTTAINFHTTIGQLGVMDSHTTLCSRATSVEPNNATLELREYNFEAEYGEHIPSHAPRLGFHYAGRYWAQIAYYDHAFRFYDSNLSGYVPLYGSQVYGAVWNDYAEYRDQIIPLEPGYCVASTDSGEVYKTSSRLQACDGVVSDTFGFAIGETDNCKTPLAVAGRVLAYCEGDRYDYHAGDTVCATNGGLVTKMTRDEIKEYPDRIVGIVSEIPEYETWGTGNVNVDNRIWIKVK